MLMASDSDGSTNSFARRLIGIAAFTPACSATGLWLSSSRSVWLWKAECLDTRVQRVRHSFETSRSILLNALTLLGSSSEAAEPSASGLAFMEGIDGAYVACAVSCPNK